MSFSYVKEKKGLSLPGLIDIIFLLLIFSLVTLSFTDAKVESEKPGETGTEFPLPEARVAETVELNEVLQTLLFQIEHVDRDNPESPKVIYALWPSIRDSVSIIDAKVNAARDSLFGIFPVNFLELSDREFSRLPPCTLITNNLRRYKETYFYIPRVTNAVEIRAVPDTEFRIVNFIMEQVSTYGDTIPQLMWHTFSGRGIGDGL